MTIPDSMTSIGDEAFRNCRKLEKVDFPSSVTDFGRYAFSGTPWLEGLGDFPVVNGCLLEGPARQEMVIPDGVTSIAGYAFHGYNQGNHGDNSLKSVTIPNSVTNIGESAFRFCKDLTALSLPDSVTSIGEYAFWACDSLTSITIPSGVRSIERGTFGGCKGLSGITIPSNIVEIKDDAFTASGLTSITIPSSLKTIGKGAFSNCQKLAEFSPESSITSISEQMFSGCSSLKTVVIPSSVTSIEDHAFSRCDSLTSVMIPSSVTSISDSAFHTMFITSQDESGSTFDEIVISGLTIHGAAGSYAETYAKANNIPFAADAPASTDAPAKPAFTDVAENSPFKDAIAWAVEKNITKGTSATTFGPSNICTHNHILTFLWRANSSPAAEGANDFEKAAAWAKSKGLVDSFDGGAACTRSQTVTYLWKLAGSPETAVSDKFADVAADAEYAQAVAWAVEQKITGGITATTFGPSNTCTRGQIVTFLYRAMA